MRILSVQRVLTSIANYNQAGASNNPPGLCSSKNSFCQAQVTPLPKQYHPLYQPRKYQILCQSVFKYQMLVRFQRSTCLTALNNNLYLKMTIQIWNQQGLSQQHVKSNAKIRLRILPNPSPPNRCQKCKTMKSITAQIFAFPIQTFICFLYCTN